MAEILGTCLCGAVNITVTDPVEWLGVCHCRKCQRWSGGIWAGFPAPEQNVRVSGPVQTFASSALADRAFCKTCGTHLWMRDRSEGADYDLMPGVFDAAHAWPLKSEIYTDEAMAAFALKGDHKRATAAAYRTKNPQTAEVT